jgi:predicted nucleic acid-binding Zn ribbon protein
MERIGDLLPEAARRLGLERELRIARASSTWNAIVGEHVPPAAGACRLVSVEGRTLVVEADAPIVGQELRIRSAELLAAFAAAPAGFPVSVLRVRVRAV